MTVKNREKESTRVVGIGDRDMGDPVLGESLWSEGTSIYTNYCRNCSIIKVLISIILSLV